MKKHVAAALLGIALFIPSLPAHATDNAAVKSTDVKIVAPSALSDGENSYTEGQAKERFTAAGFTNVSGAVLSDKGIWTATGTKDAKEMKLGLDYKGNISAE
jgi:hypothetical protein